MKSISVTEVLNALARGLPRDTQRPASTRLLGHIYHEVFARLVDPESTDNAMNLLADCDPDPNVWKAKLREHAYDRLLGPLLTRHRTALSGSGERVLDAWASVGGLANWLAGIAASVERKPEALNDEHWDGLRKCFSTEIEVGVELNEPGWTQPVQLTGRIDSVVQVPGRPDRCLLELKTGRVPDELALAQLCLYQLALDANGEGKAERLVILRFGPDGEETVVEGKDLELVRQRLLKLIGELTQKSEPPVKDEFPKRLHRAFQDFGVEVQANEPAAVGPTFKRYPLTLGRGVRVNRVEGLAEDIEVRLGQEGLIIHRHRGRVVADVRREDRQIVHFDEILRNVEGPSPGVPRSKFILGQEIDGTLRWADLAEPTTAHVLVAGTTGSGKSEWMRTAIGSMMLTNTPETLRLVLVDPKRNAFGALKGSPYLWGDRGLLFPPEHSVHDALDDLIDEMEARYVELERSGANDIAHLAKIGGKIFPRIVLLCDEYYDLMTSSPADRRALESRIGKLGAKARAAGIHLLLATQQPSRKVVTGAIDTNLPARVALKAGSAIESRSILREAGAERLLGHGDLLFKDVGNPVRLQAPLMSDEARTRVFKARP